MPLIPEGQAIIRWIAANKAIPGVGAATATRLWQTYGPKLYDHLREGDVGAIAEIAGPFAAHVIAQEFRLLRNEVDVLQHFDRYGFDARTSIAASRLWGAGAIAKLDANPYVMALLQPWKIVDERALRLGVANDDPRRLIAAAGDVVARRYRGFERMSGGHTAGTRNDFIRGLRSLLGRQSETLAELAFDLALTAGELVQCGELYQGRGPALMERAIEKAIVDRTGDSLISQTAIASAITETEAHLGFALDPTQVAAINLAVGRRFCVVDGPAGTGKSTVTRAIMVATQKVGRAYYQIALSGRAAKRLVEATSHEAMTVHRFLKALTNGALKLSAATLLIDEASMISTPNLWQIITWVPADTNIILVGDPGQLPPIGAGNPLRALVASDGVARATLDQIHRQKGESPIPTVAQFVRKGGMPLLPAFDPRDPDRAGVYIVACPSADVPRKVLDTFEAFVGEPVDVPDRDAMRRLHGARTQILGMTIHGPAGVRAISDAVERRWLHGQPQIPMWGFAEGSKILWTKNSYNHDTGLLGADGTARTVDIMNGSLGVVQRQTSEGARTLFDDDEVGAVDIRISNLQRVLRGWAITVHKAQGSAFERVIVPIVPSRLLDRLMLYTAITRARRTVVLVGDPEVLFSAAEARGRAATRLQCLLRS
ncbi:MAG: AAA family ATPase [Candidatus Sphingomonas colombiensis]|nr:AAA family ATPase [Sphingomonas sp.]WEK44299.1 MAG: AAA family ATPase [Sphingomonas sp.]